MKIEEVLKLSEKAPNFRGEIGRIQAEALMKQAGFEADTLYQELEMTSRYVDTHQDVTYSNSRVNLHSHNFYEFLFCHSAADVE